jgi:hypothetical protein
MKRIITALAIVALAVGIAPQAHAATTFQGGPLTALSSNAPTSIHIALTGYPTTYGLYIEQAVKTTDGTRPTVHGAPLWVSSVAADLSQGATSIKSDIVLVVDNGHSWGADCAHQQCGIFIRADHNATSITSEDQFIPLTFEASTAPAPTSTAAPSSTPAPTALPADTIDIKVAGSAVPLSIWYETPITLQITTESGLAPKLISYVSDLCVLDGFTVKALKGTGTCDIAVSTAGNEKYGPATKHVVLTAEPATQTLNKSSAAVKVGKSVSLSGSTSFGEMIKYTTSSKNCSVKGSTVKGLKTGSCVVSASAPGTANYGALKASVVVTVKK